MNSIRAQKVIRETRTVYNRLADLFSSTRDYVWNDVKPLIQYVSQGDTVIDLGCGNGRLYQLLGKNQVNYIGIDQSDKLIKIAREKHPGVRFLVSNMTKMALQNDIADSIFCIASFHHLPSAKTRVKALKEMKRILKDHGKIIMINWNLYSDWARGKEFEGDEKGDFYIPWKDAKKQVLGTRYYHGFMLEELHELAEAAELKIIQQWYTKDGKVSSLGPGDNILTVLTPQ